VPPDSPPVALPAWDAVIDHVDAAFLLLDQHGTVLRANAAARAIVGSALDRSQRVWDLPLFAPHVDDLRAAVEGACAGAPGGPVESDVVEAEGERVLSWRIRGAGADGLLVMSGHEVTRGVLAERALAQQQQRYRDAFERTDTVWWEIDLDTGEGSWPDAALSFYGIAAGDRRPALDAWRSRLHPDDYAADERLMRRILEERWETFETVNRILHPERGLRWVRTQGRVVCGPDGEPARLVGIDTDITGHHQAEEALRQRERDFRLLADSVPDIVWTARPDGAVDFYNQRWTDYSGARREDGEQWGWRPVVHPDDEERTVAAWLHAVDTGTLYEVRHRIRRRDGRFRWFVSRAAPVVDSVGRVTKWFGTATDIDDQVESELALQRRVAQQSTVATLGLHALGAVEVSDVLDAVVSALATALPADSCLALRGQPTPGAGLVVEAATGVPEGWVGRTIFPAGESHAAFALASGDPVLVDDLLTETRFGDGLLRDALAARSVVAVPIGGPDAPYGVLSAVADEPGAFDAADADFLRAVSYIVAEAVRRREAVDALRVRVGRLAALHDIDRSITEATEVDTVLRVVVGHVKEQLGVDAVGVLVYVPELQVLEFAAGVGFRSTAVREGFVRLGEGIAGQVALERRAQRAADEALRSRIRPEILDRDGFRAYWGVPLVAKGEVQGVLELFSRSALEPDGEWEEFLEALAVQAALAIHNAALFTDLQKSHDTLRLAYDATIEGWAKALDLKDHQTEGHSRRVTELTLRLARRMGMPLEDLVHVRRGALLHDIGKMAIPDVILLKQGELDADEWEVVRQHPQHAFDMLAPIAFLRPALDIPYAHHERWDGSGYPRGLAGQDIPLAARIFAVVDVFDALTMQRPYWPAWPRDEAIAYLRDQAGTHFDPQVVESFLEMMG
jgi:PAS domain S-box-containing protein/putative nucleotidyltransferase with HDIG domain